jgi:tetratricopeptide (TPR) repeat protein
VAQKAYETVRIADLQREDGWFPIRRELDVQAFGINAWTARDTDGTVIPEHHERPTGHQELYLVLDGHATFTVAGEEVDAPRGTIVFVRDPAAMRGAVAREPGTTVLSVGAKEGAAYRPRAWEMNADVFALLDAGEHAEAKRLLVDALDRYEDRATILYNLACAEAQLGETDMAIEHLRAALAERPDWVDSAGQDADLEPLRDDPRFAELIWAQ